MTNPMGIVTNNPKAFIKSPSPVAGNMRLGVNNVAPIPNVANPKSIGSPSANGYSQIPINPKYTPYTGYEPLKAIENPTQAVQTTAKTPISLGGVLGVAGKVFAVVALPSVVDDVSRAVADLTTIPLRVGILNERVRLDKLLKERERVAQAIATARVDSWSTEGRVAGVWNIQTAGSSHNATPFNGTGTMVISGYSDDQFSTILGPATPTPGYSVVYLAKNGEIISAVVVSRPRGGSGFLGGSVSISPSFQQGGGVSQSPAPFPIATPPPPSEWLYGSPLVTISGNAAKILDKMDAAKPTMPMMKDDPNVSPDNLQPSVPNPEIAKTPSGFANPSSAPSSSNSGISSVPASQAPVGNGLYNKGALPDFKQITPSTTPQYDKGSQVAPNPPVSKAPELFSIPTIDPNAALIMGAIATGTVTTTNLLNQINQQTKPENQQANAKEGSCQAMNSPSCRKDMVDDIKNPINQNIDAKTGLLAANQLGQDVALGNILAKVTSVFERLGRLFDNSLINKAMQYVTMITVIHNAAMLSRGIAETLGSALDQGLQVFGLQAKMEDKDGAITGVNAVLGKSFENLIKGIIGADNYTALNNTWIQANRIYQTGINLISNVQSILDSTTAVAELTSNRLATWMNAARSAGLVRENAYGAQSENVTKFNAFMNKLENLEQGASNVAAIAGNVLTTQQAITEIQTNRQEFENALKDKPQGTGLPENDPAKAAAATKKEQSVWTIADFSIVKPPELP